MSEGHWLALNVLLPIFALGGRFLARDVPKQHTSASEIDCYPERIRLDAGVYYPSAIAFRVGRSWAWSERR